MNSQHEGKQQEIEMVPAALKIECINLVPLASLKGGSS